jgi:3-oxoacyl-[acyl-carrier protein] reductase
VREREARGDPRLAGRVALVTGGGRGLGLAIASRLAQSGATVVIGDVNAGAAAAAARGLVEEGWSVSGVGLDVANEKMVIDVTDDIARDFGRLDILVNNACRARYSFLFEMTSDDWHDAVAVCLTGTFLCSRAAAQLMRTQASGKIVNISSIAGSIGLARTSAYAAAKGGVEALTRVLAVELAPFNIQVNAVAPGPVDTEFSRASLTPEIRQARLARIPAGRFGVPEEVAAAVGFLCSQGADWITGSVLRVDGGYIAAGSMERWTSQEDVDRRNA